MGVLSKNIVSNLYYFDFECYNIVYTGEIMDIVSHEDFEISVDSLIPNNKIKSHPKFDRFLNIARDLSINSKFRKNKMGAILVIKGRIVAKGFNSTKSHPLQKYYNIERTDITEGAPHYLHAEMDVLKRVKDQNLKNAELFVYHVNKHGEQKMARPCAACMKAIKEKGIEVIHYSTPDGLATEHISQDQKILVKKGRAPI